MVTPIVIAETSLFVRQASDVWSDDERNEFVDYIACNPTEGDVIPETGVRKLRWSRSGNGKRSGVRVIYFYYDTAHPLYLLMVYAKPRQENLTPQEKRKVRDFVDVIKKRSN